MPMCVNTHTHNTLSNIVSDLSASFTISFLGSQPVLCHLLPDGLPLCVLAVLHGAWHMVGFS